MRYLYFLLSFLCNVAYAQMTLFSQDFSSGANMNSYYGSDYKTQFSSYGAVANYIQLGSCYSFFGSAGGGNFSITDGKLRIIGSTSALDSRTSLRRLSSFELSYAPEIPKNLWIEFALSSNDQDEWQFNVSGISIPFSEQQQHVVIVQNRYDQETLTYLGPGATAASNIAAGKYTLWINGVNVLESDLPNTASFSYSRFNDPAYCNKHATRTTYIDDIIVKSLADNAMPVSLTKFDVKSIQNRKVQLSWQTAWESNANHFDIERSRDGRKFEAIGNLKAKGNSNASNLYEFVDEQPYFGTSYYRLNQVDYDGSSHKYSIVSIEISGDEKQFGVFPNPSPVERFQLKIEDTQNNIIKLYDLKGNAVPFDYKKISENVIDIRPVGFIESGTYLIDVQTPGAKRSHRVLLR